MKNRKEVVVSEEVEIIHKISFSLEEENPKDIYFCSEIRFVDFEYENADIWLSDSCGNRINISKLSPPEKREWWNATSVIKERIESLEKKYFTEKEK